MPANQRSPGGPRPKAEDSLLRTSVLVLARLHSFGHAISPLSAERLDYEPGSGGYCRILVTIKPMYHQLYTMTRKYFFIALTYFHFWNDASRDHDDGTKKWVFTFTCNVSISLTSDQLHRRFLTCLARTPNVAVLFSPIGGPRTTYPLLPPQTPPPPSTSL